MFNLGAMLNTDSTDPVVGKSSTLITCSAEKIFQYLGDDLFLNYPKWSPEVKELEQLTPGPVQLGTMGRQVRIDKGRRTESSFKISTYEPGKCLTFVGVSYPFRCSYEIQTIEAEESAQLTFTFELLKLLMVMRPFEDLVRTAINDSAITTVRNIKDLVEAEKFKNTSSRF